MSTSEYIDEVIKEYKDGRINTYLMLKYLNDIKSAVAQMEEALSVCIS